MSEPEMFKIKEYITQLMSSKAKDEVRDLERAIQDLETEKRLHSSELAQLGDRRRELLMNDEDDLVTQLDRKGEKLNLAIEKIEELLPDLHVRLQIARDGKLLAVIKKFHFEHADLLDLALASYMQTHEAFDAVRKHRECAGALGLGGNIGLFPELPFMLRGDFMIHFNEAIEGIRHHASNLTEVQKIEPVAGKTRPGTPKFHGHLVQTPDKKVPSTGIHHMLRPFIPHDLQREPERANEFPSAMKNPLPASVNPKPRPLYRETAGEGERLVFVIRPGYESPISGACRTGDIIALPIETAEHAVQRGAVEFYSESGARPAL